MGKIFVVRVRLNKEKSAIDMLYEKIAMFNYDVSAAISPYNISGYVFIEAKNSTEVEKAISGIGAFQSILGEVPFEEVMPHLSPKTFASNFNLGEIVEAIEGPLQGLRVKITSIDIDNDTLTVVPLEASIPMPITIPSNHLGREKKG